MTTATLEPPPEIASPDACTDNATPAEDPSPLSVSEAAALHESAAQPVDPPANSSETGADAVPETTPNDVVAASSDPDAEYRQAIELIVKAGKAAPGVLTAGMELSIAEAKTLLDRMKNDGMIKSYDGRVTVVPMVAEHILATLVRAPMPDQKTPPQSTDEINAAVKSMPKAAAARKAGSKSARSEPADLVMVEQMELNLDDLIEDLTLQPRVTPYDEDAVDRYTDQYRTAIEGNQKVPLPPLKVCLLDDGYHVFDGFQRLKAARGAGLTSLLCDVSEGSREQAMVAAISTNTTHGLPLSYDDLNKAAESLIKMGMTNNHEIGRICNLSHTQIGRLRKKLQDSGIWNNVPDEVDVTRNGKAYKQKHKKSIKKKMAKPSTSMPMAEATPPEEAHVTMAVPSIDLQPLYNQFAEMKSTMEQSMSMATSVADKAALTSFARQCRDYFDQQFIELSGNVVAN